ncbi:hypothetical protein GCM10025868_10850 [Angustibacter aerolatus]|uniref:YncI copper-binding domain-containing protein n=1 Tax=Angustibacter aerolatus TaxID=1162965 RepID=A0ABQ6JF65_9ACTN|nr:YcnI family protein [Angustibacter aerolatus]GMA85835.1 hypothetical protein GCM10025868_10850 [Angustibacter aerolatus]
MHRLAVRPVLAASLAAALAGVPLAAQAHVRVSPDSTTTGSYSELTFRVPTESATASTTKVSVTLPQDHPFLSVSVRPLDGWTSTITEAKPPTPVQQDGTTITKAARTVTWTAQPGHAVRPGQYEKLSIVAGPLPAPGEVSLPATQTYSDGEVVRWDEPMEAGSAEPEHPAPEFTVTAADAPATASASTASSAPAGSSGTPVTRAASTSDPASRWLGGGALVAALAALVLAGGAFARSRRRA